MNDPIIVRDLGPSVDLLRLHSAFPSRYPFLLQSVARGPDTARWDILFGFPGEQLVLDAEAGLARDGLPSPSRDFLHELDRWFAAEKVPQGVTNLPFRGGWFVFLSYELAAQIEPSLSLPAVPEMPTAVAVRVPAALLHNHETGRILAVVESNKAHLLDAISADLAVALAADLPDLNLPVADVQEDNPERFLAGVMRIHEYILSGDVFQVNLSGRWLA